jgi:cation:H+ antiporter
MIFLQILLLVVGFLMLVKGADWFVEGTAGIAEKFGIPQLVVGLTVVAMGTSAPEAAVSITAALKENADIAIGNIVGSNIFNILFVLGTSSLIIPLTFERHFLIDTVIAIAAGVILWISVAKSKKLTRPWGIVMLAAYAIYLLYLFLM